MDNPNATNPNDFKVVSFTNKADFTFTPEMGCMYDGRPISGITGAPGINAGESMTLPYKIGHRLAINLAKVVKLRKAPIADEANNPVGRVLWSDEDLEKLKNTFLTELYVEQKPVMMSETDRLMAKVEEYKKMVEQLLPQQPTQTTPNVQHTENVVVSDAVVSSTGGSTGYADKSDVIKELEVRNIKFDRRQSKANLEKLLTA